MGIVHHISQNISLTLPCTYTLSILGKEDASQRTIHTFREQNDMQRLSSLPEKMNSFLIPATILG